MNGQCVRFVISVQCLPFVYNPIGVLNVCNGFLFFKIGFTMKYYYYFVCVEWWNEETRRVSLNAFFSLNFKCSFLRLHLTVLNSRCFSFPVFVQSPKHWTWVFTLDADAGTEFGPIGFQLRRQITKHNYVHMSENRSIMWIGCFEKNEGKKKATFHFNFSSLSLFKWKISVSSSKIQFFGRKQLFNSYRCIIFGTIYLIDWVDTPAKSQQPWVLRVNSKNLFTN